MEIIFLVPSLLSIKMKVLYKIIFFDVVIVSDIFTANNGF